MKERNHRFGRKKIGHGLKRKMWINTDSFKKYPFKSVLSVKSVSYCFLDKFSPFLSFGDSFNQTIPFNKQIPHITFQKQKVGNFT